MPSSSRAGAFRQRRPIFNHEGRAWAIAARRGSYSSLFLLSSGGQISLEKKNNSVLNFGSINKNLHINIFNKGFRLLCPLDSEPPSGEQNSAESRGYGLPRPFPQSSVGVPLGCMASRFSLRSWRRFLGRGFIEDLGGVQ